MDNGEKYHNGRVADGRDARMSDSLARIADALERLADTFCPRTQRGAQVNQQSDWLLAGLPGGNGQSQGPSQNGNGKASGRDFYTTSDAAKETGWSPFTIRERCNWGLIRSVKSGGQHRIPREEVERIKREGLPAAAPTPPSRPQP